MFATDAIDHLIAHFDLLAAGPDPQGNPTYDFTGKFTFTATELDPTHLQLAADLPDLNGVDRPALTRRLLEASVQGAETGAGQIGLHPTLGMALIQTLDTTPLDLALFEMRFVDFSLYAEYWRIEGAARVLAETAPARAPRNEEVQVPIRI